MAQAGEESSIRYNLPVDRAALSIARLQADTGWTPATPLAAAVQDQLAWQAAP
jgi:nucleoside-diphosphate-sugar epimerase